MFKHIKGNGVESEEWGSLIVQRLLNDEGHQISFAKMELRAPQRTSLNRKSDIYYYILKGEGTFTFDENRIEVKEGDMVYVPKNTKYRDAGEMTMLGIAIPRFDPKETVYFD